MTADELRREASRVFGHRKWKKEIAKLFGVHLATVYRWIKNDEVPPGVALYFEARRNQHKIEKLAKQLAKG